MNRKRLSAAFTLVELVVVIAVLGILFSLTVVGFNAWRSQVAEAEVKNDVLGILTGMDNARNRLNAYPVLAEGDEFNGSSNTKDIYTQSRFVTATYRQGDGSAYCVDIRSKVVPGAYLFLNTANGNKSAKVGTCEGGEGSTPPSTDQTVFVFNTAAPGCAGTVQLPVSVPASGGTIDWGDGTVQPRTSSLMSHTYATAGKYTASYTGPIDWGSYYLNVDPVKAKCLTRVQQWASNINPVRISFSNASNLVYVAEPPHSLTDMSTMFDGASSFNQPIGNWDVSRVTRMDYMFMNASSFNQPLNSWDVSKVVTMRYFLLGTAFNQPLDAWDTSSLVNMSGVFSSTPFNQNINNWNTSNVQNLDQTFSSNVVFNQPLNNWDTSNVTSMNSTFYGSKVFNQDISDWNTSNVTNMSTMLLGANAFNQPIGKWDVSKVTTMRGMMQMLYSFNQPLNSWNTSNVTDMLGMFYGMSSFNQPLNNWDTSKVTNFASMFYGAGSFNQNISNWNTTSMVTGTSFRTSSPLSTANTPPALR